MKRQQKNAALFANSRPKQTMSPTILATMRDKHPFSIGIGRTHWGPQNQIIPPQGRDRLGWFIPFSDESRTVAHMLVMGAMHIGIAYRACKPGHIINPALAQHSPVGIPYCKKCRQIEARA